MYLPFTSIFVITLSLVISAFTLPDFYKSNGIFDSKFNDNIENTQHLFKSIYLYNKIFHKVVPIRLRA